MPTSSLPALPNLVQLRNQAREFQRAVLAGETTALSTAGLNSKPESYALSTAQRMLAARYGFRSWDRLRRQVRAINDRTWVWADTEPDANENDPPAHQFLRLACLNFTRDDPARRTSARRILAAHGELSRNSLAVAAACADVLQVRAHLAADPSAATATLAPYGWSPLLYCAYARVDVGLTATVDTVAALLRAGADPNDGRFFGGLPTPFTALTGAFGGGEADQPPHPHGLALARVLLDAGADPNDSQALYNRMFADDDDFLQLLFEFGLGSGDGGPWRRLLPDLLPAPAAMLRSLLSWAITHDQRGRVALLARHGVDVRTPLDAAGPPGNQGNQGNQGTPYEVAMRSGHSELAQELRELGAHPALSPVDSFIAGALTGDATAVRTTPAGVVRTARAQRPALIVWAAAQGRREAVDLLVQAGFNLNARGRSDVPIEQPWHTALHAAVERNDPALVAHLLELGADRTIRDARFDGTALDWAHHLGHSELANLLSE